jgi:hypothetical protein
LNKDYFKNAKLQCIGRDSVETFGIIILIINVLIVGFVVWTVSSINEKLELLIRLQLKKDDIHFNDKDMVEEIEKYRDR